MSVVVASISDETNSVGLDGIFLDTRQKEGEDGAMAYRVFGAAESEPASMTVDDAGGDPEAETRTVEVFGSVKGFEEARLHDRGHAVTSVSDCDANSPPAIGVSWGIV
jgi:hypothetical protein